MPNYSNVTTNNQMEKQEQVRKNVGCLEIVDEYDNVFDIRDSILNTATLDSAFISFYNPTLDYIFEYFFDDDRIWLEGDFDEEYWTDERIEEITERMKITNVDRSKGCEYCRSFMAADIDIETAVNIMFEEMVKYSKYMKSKAC